MKILISVEGQFLRRTGIQQYVDSLLGALYKVNTAHEIAAFAPNVWSPTFWNEHAKDGFFDWLQSPQVRLETAGTDFTLIGHPLFANRRGLHGFIRKIDGRIINSYKGRTVEQRALTTAGRYDLLHMNDPVRPALLNYKAKHNIATIHDVIALTLPTAYGGSNDPGWAPYFEYVKKRCDRVLTVSEFSKSDIVKHLGIPADRVDVTPTAPRASTRRVTDAEDLHLVLKKFGLVDVPFVLYSGNLEPRKNLMRLVEAFAQVVREGGLPDHKLVLAGGNENRYDLEVRLRALECGLTRHVVTTGYVSNAEMNALMSSCAAFAFVSEYEGFGMPPLEAMVCGAPVVASNTTSLPEVVGDAAILVDPVDVGEIAGALHLLLTNSAENARRRALSLERAKLFSWERTARLTLQSYEAAVL